jgi:hypothetical protein
MNVRALFAAVILLSLTSAGYQARADICIQEKLKVSHIIGRVVAPWNGGEEPIPKASVLLKVFLNDEWQTKFTTNSDDRGFFRIENVPSGIYELDVRHDNFRTFGTRVDLKSSKSQASREIVVSLGVGFHDCGSADVRKIAR